MITGLKEGVNVTELVIPEGVTEIAASAFHNKGITKVTLPESLVVIGGIAFARNALTEITIPKNVTTIGSYAFNGNGSLTSVKVESSKITSCENMIFSDCNINSISLPEEMLILPKLFNSAGMQIGTKVTIPAGVQVIGDSAFSGTNLKEVIFAGNELTEIQGSAFANCKIEEEHSITYVYEDVQGNVISGEEVFNENPATYTIEKDIWLKSPEMAGYRFKGWYNAEGKK